MIDFYTYGTINGQSVAIALEEMNLYYNLHAVDLMKGEQRNPEFLKLNPTGRIPVIMDNETGVVVNQSSAILIYLAEKTDQFLPSEVSQRAKVLEWLMFHATDMAPNLYNNFYLKSLIKEPQPEAAEFIKNRYLNLYQYFDQQLKETEFLAGADYSIADMACFPSVFRLINAFEDLGYENIKRWFQTLKSRPEVTAGMSL